MLGYTSTDPWDRLSFVVLSRVLLLFSSSVTYIPVLFIRLVSSMNRLCMYVLVGVGIDQCLPDGLLSDFIVVYNL